MQAAPPMDSEINFNPAANSSPANQNHNQFKIQRKRGILNSFKNNFISSNYNLTLFSNIIFIVTGVKDAYVNVMNNIKTSENILTPDSIFQANQTSTNIYNPSL